MTCQEFWDAMPELEGQPDADAAAHLAGCSVCGAVLNNQRVLFAGLRATAADWRRTKAPGRVEGKLLAAFRGQAGLAAPPPARRWWSTALAWAAAALVVAGAFLLFATRGRQAQAPANPSSSTEMAAIDWSARLPAELTAEGAGEGFVPVPNADRLPPNEDLNVVRVEVPRSAMIALGYSVTADRAAERVRADVVLGSDGLARAVRFLDE
jgi:HAMP domain-containing protein